MSEAKRMPAIGLGAAGATEDEIRAIWWEHFQNLKPKVGR